METIKEIRALIENRTGFKTTTRRHKTGSMKGYITVGLRKVKGQFVEMSIELSREIIIKFEMPEPKPTFSNTYQVHYFVGITAIWNS